MLGEDRVITFDQPGTTRDSISIDFERNKRPYTLIDTAGVRRRGRVLETIEKFSVIKTLQTVENANVVVLVVDGGSEISEQDAHIAGFILEAGRAVVLVVNKWDGLDNYQRETIKREVSRKLAFLLSFAGIHYISALKGTGMKGLFPSIDTAYAAAMAKVNNPNAYASTFRGRRKTAPTTFWYVSPQITICSSRRFQSAADNNSWQCSEVCIENIPALSGKFFSKNIQTRRNPITG